MAACAVDGRALQPYVPCMLNLNILELLHQALASCLSTSCSNMPVMDIQSHKRCGQKQHDVAKGNCYLLHWPHGWTLHSA